MELLLSARLKVVLVSSAVLSACFVMAFAFRSDRIVFEPERIVLPADGRVHPALRLRTMSGRALNLADVEGSGERLHLTATDQARIEGLLRAPVSPGQSQLRLRWRGQSVNVPIDFVFDPTDSYGDGTPDFLRLHTAEDQRAFRGWFTMLAEREARLAPERLPAEISDCSALLRYAYREALRRHDDQWLTGADTEGMAVPPSVQQYQYPETPLGSALFRVRPGAFHVADLEDDGFAQFADARTLMMLNTHFMSRELGVAQPGDLLFYRQLEQDSPYHSMIVAGQHSDWVVYHTGPIGRAKGEVRRVSVEDLLHHPDARWRPLPENSNFLGVYRWNILRDRN
ncbi:MAG TPA: DUF1175 family protein [Edaphobacter sp.]|nr:DUF1175 family protein [Edaphobacter sp.]